MYALDYRRTTYNPHDDRQLSEHAARRYAELVAQREFDAARQAARRSARTASLGTRLLNRVRTNRISNSNVADPA